MHMAMRGTFNSKAIGFISCRQAHSAPARLRLRRRIKSESSFKSSGDPYIFHPLVRTIEPVNQALRLTKTIPNEGMPSVVSQIENWHFGAILPQISRSVEPHLYFDSENKFKYIQRSKGLLVNVVKAVWSTSSSYPGLLKQTISYQPGLKVQWKRFKHNIQVSGRTGVLFSSSSPLPNFASISEVNKTAEIPVHNDEIISPVFELSQNSSKPAFDSGFFDDVNPFPRTLVITEKNWKLTHLIAQGIMFSFGRLVERAICKNKANFGEVLEYPLSMRAVVYNDNRMALLCYQLNTLDFEGDEGVKNQLWMVSDIPINMGSQSQTQKLEKEKEEFRSLVALLMYGENDEHTAVPNM